MTDRAVILRYHEIALKGENRGWFEERLMVNARKLVRRALGDDNRTEVTRQHGRILVHADWNAHEVRLRTALGRLFGVASFSPVRFVPTDRETLALAAIEETRRHIGLHGMPRSFRVQTRRTEKAFPEPSMEIDREIGSRIKAAIPELTVQLKSPELTVGIELRFEQSYVWTEKIPGTGGLPVGTNGRLLALLSGGLDSPVAAIQVLRRGSPVSYLHFYGTPFVGEEALTKVEDLARIVNRFQPEPQPLHVVPFGKIQERVALATNPKIRTILYRRLMFRIASRLAPRLDAQALVTGESLGQVASQTLENLACIDASAELPVLRPLIAYDKDEIIAQAQRWESYETSIRPAADCCTLFADRHPAIRSSMEAILAEEAKFPVEELVREALEKLEVRRVY